ncbi:MAG: response regulator transcription factor [Eubacterium sp.]
MFKILITDDEMKIRETIGDYMTAKGFSVTLAENGKQAVELAENKEFDLIILDVMMPVLDGISACSEIRSFSNVPILFLSALGEERDLLGGFKSGCDDYIVKPFPLSVLYQKCVTMIKRCKGADADNKITVGNIILDYSSHRVYTDDKSINLPGRDFELLSYLMQNKNIVLNRELILTKIWGYDYDGDIRVVDTHIKRLRKALGSSAGQIKTVIGVGYSVEEV